VRKGWSKTELGAWIAICELHKDAPVRFGGWDDEGNPIGIGVTDPYIPLLATTLEQSDELAYNAVKTILEHSYLADDFDIGLERIMRLGGDGKIAALSAAPSARDGARTTFSFIDESHHWNSPRLRKAHKILMANLPKRKAADAWMLECTTAFSPGENSIAEQAMDYARLVHDGTLKDSRLFFFHRQASDSHDLTTKDGIRSAVMEASGPVASWSDIESIIAQWDDAGADKTFLERVWLNRLVRASERAFDIEQFKVLADEDYRPAPGAMITLGFDGARWHDATAIVATEIVTGFQWLAGLWERPAELDLEYWEVDAADVDGVMAELMDTYKVWRAYCDPPYWETTVADWAGRYGSERVLEWWTNRPKQMAYAIKQFNTAVTSGDLLHDGNPHYIRHVGNAVRKVLRIRDEEGQPLWTIYKERPDSPHKIDAAMAGVLSWEARNDALTAGVGKVQQSVYESRGIVVA
jgi:phage terminase large subunit-like protein